MSKPVVLWALAGASLLVTLGAWGDCLLDTSPASTPGISAGEALDLGWGQTSGAGLDATSVQLIYATYVPTRSATPEHLPVWVLRYSGTFPLYGGSRAGSCVPQRFNVVINASTGEFVFAFSD